MASIEKQKQAEPEPIRVYLAPRETGWVRPLGEYLALIDNVPIEGPYNLGDVVALQPPLDEGGLPRLGRVVYRRYERRSTVSYRTVREFYEFRCLLACVGAAIEGMTSPVGPGQPGYALVAHPAEVDVVLLARSIGLEGEEEPLPEVGEE